MFYWGHWPRSDPKSHVIRMLNVVVSFKHQFIRKECSFRKLLLFRIPSGNIPNVIKSKLTTYDTHCLLMPIKDVQSITAVYSVAKFQPFNNVNSVEQKRKMSNNQLWHMLVVQFFFVCVPWLLLQRSTFNLSLQKKKTFDVVCSSTNVEWNPVIGCNRNKISTINYVYRYKTASCYAV